VPPPDTGEVDALLSDGATVHIRPISPADADALVALHSRFSERTRYFRYFSPYPRIPARDLARFVNVDHHNREALVAQTGDQLIAVARYDRLAQDAGDAEVALVVEDAHQGRGVGSILLEHLAEAARANGITRFVGEVLPENRTMLRVFGQAGYEVTREYAGGVVHLTFSLASTERSVQVQWDRERLTEAASIGRLIAPASILVYGVRRDGTGVGATLLRHVLDSGFTGTVTPIHPELSTVADLAAYPSAAAAPSPADLALIAVPSPAVPSTVADLGAAGGHGLVVVTDGPSRQDMVTLARAHRLRLIGPNCLGVANTDPAVRLNATLVPSLPPPGRIGLFCQSGAMGVALLAEAYRRGVGVSSFVSVGDGADVSGNDALQFWRCDPRTDVVLLHLEGFGNPRKFARIARQMGREKPIVVVAPGSPAADPLLDDRAAEQLLTQSGVIRVQTVGELFDVGQLLDNHPLPTGRRVVVVANSVGLSALAAAACVRAGLVATESAPADGDVDQRVRAGAADPEADAVLVVLAPPVGGPAAARPLDPIEEVAAGSDKLILACFLGGTARVRGGLAYYPTVEEAVRALRHVAAYADWRREPPGVLPAPFATDAGTMLGRYGIQPLPETRVADPAAAMAAARDLAPVAVRGAVALKAAAGALKHRLDLGAVQLWVTGDDAVRRAYLEIAELFGPDVVVQPMARPGVACVVEVLDDPRFGPVVGFGLGGVAAELVGDRAWRAAPLTDRDATALVHTPRAAAMLYGYRGAEPVDVPALIDLLLRLGQLADEQPTVRRLTLNPVLAHQDGCTVLHASIHYGPTGTRPDTGPRRLD
jgi:acyl-CoA synthetase (NDP forming)/GNAT superfamily N-acetyltransferase